MSLPAPSAMSSSGDRQAYRSGHHCEREPLAMSGETDIKMPKQKGLAFQTAIIGRCRRREAGVGLSFSLFLLAQPKRFKAFARHNHNRNAPVFRLLYKDGGVSFNVCRRSLQNSQVLFFYP